MTHTGLSETLFDITLVAGDLLQRNALRDVDSRELYGTCLDLALHFETQHRNFDERDYLTQVDEYAHEELTKLYGKETRPMERTKIYDHLLVTLGCRAGVMDMRGDITLPCGTYDEDDLAEFAARTVDDYMATDGDTSFDEFIETALLTKYGKERDLCGN